MLVHNKCYAWNPYFGNQKCWSVHLEGRGSGFEKVYCLYTHGNVDIFGWLLNYIVIYINYHTRKNIYKYQYTNLGYKKYLIKTQIKYNHHEIRQAMRQWWVYQTKIHRLPNFCCIIPDFSHFELDIGLFQILTLDIDLFEILNWTLALFFQILTLGIGLQMLTLTLDNCKFWHCKSNIFDHHISEILKFDINPPPPPHPLWQGHRLLC